MAYKFQLGNARLSGSVVQEGTVTAESSAVSGSSITLPNGGLTLESVAVTSTAAELNLVDGASAGSVVNSKAVIYTAGGVVNATQFSASSGLSGSQITLIDASSIAGAGLEDDETGKLRLNIDGLTEATTTALTQADMFVFSDGGTEKKITFSNIEDEIFANISSDATVAAGGALTIANDAVNNDKLANMTRGTVKVGGTANAPTDLSASAGGQILVGNGLDVASVAVSGDATLASGGALTIANDAVNNDKLANIARGSVKVGGASNAPTDLDAKTSGQILVGDGTDINSVAVSGDIALASNGAVTIQANAVEGSMLNSNVAGTGLVYAGSNLDVSASQTVITDILNSSLILGTAADQEYIDFSTSNQIHFVVNDTPVARAIAGTFVVDGNLHVSGTTTTVDSTTINISSSFTFEGPIDAHETILTVGTPTQDNTITLPQFSGSVPGTYHLPVLTGATTAASALVTPTEFALLDGNSSVGTTGIATGDGFLHNDNGTMKQTQIDKIAESFAGNGLQAGGVVMSLDLDTGVGAGNSFAVTSDGLALNNSVAGAGLNLASGILSVDVDELDRLASTPHSTQDEFIISDNGTEKRVNMLNVANGVFDHISNDILIAASGSATLQAAAITGKTALTSGLADTDELLVSDAGTLKRMDASVLKTYIGNNITETVQTLASAGDNDLDLSNGTIVFLDVNTAGNNMNVNLPSAAGQDGRVIKFKHSGHATRFAVLTPSGSQEIDGSNDGITLESPFAAVMLFATGSNWFVL